MYANFDIFVKYKVRNNFKGILPLSFSRKIMYDSGLIFDKNFDI